MNAKFGGMNHPNSPEYLMEEISVEGRVHSSCFRARDSRLLIVPTGHLHILAAAS